MKYIRKHKKKYIMQALPVLLAAMVLSLFIPAVAKADASGLVEPIYATDGSLYPVVDYADLLTDDEEQALAERIYGIQSTYESAIVLLTVPSTDYRSPMEYADDFYDYNGYGIGERHNGIIFLLSMEDRSWRFETTGTAIDVYTDSDQEYIFDEIKGYLSENRYYEAYDKFISLCDDELRYDYESGIFTPGKFFICLAIAIVFSLLVLFFFVGQLMTVQPAKGASNYADGGLHLTSKHDRFVRKTLHKTKIQKDSGGSSTHTGSSGTSHGGSGGHF
ncbi:TPM domain-containing protein [Butyrivibrio sp. WCD3002]|uniref:TPM domain-containing protein n=1 Tax=Butyrivibrio sp. WCD3002 TaxID=1280676 RepID=UPI0003F9DA39|nr:TPM domain-containing protein [Butyrivibrio sp. WCD3002]